MIEKFPNSLRANYSNVHYAFLDPKDLLCGATEKGCFLPEQRPAVLAAMMHATLQRCRHIACKLLPMSFPRAKITHISYRRPELHLWSSLLSPRTMPLSFSLSGRDSPDCRLAFESCGVARSGFSPNNFCAAYKCSKGTCTT